MRSASSTPPALFAPQKGATPAQVALLTRRLERLVDVYREDFGVDVAPLVGGGAAGGLAGGLAAVGGDLVSGFELVADELGLVERIEAAEVVVTGEGFLDDESFDGKVVGGVLALARRSDRPVLAVVGEVLAGVELPDGLHVVSLVERCGRTAALEHATGGGAGKCRAGRLAELAQAAARRPGGVARRRPWPGRPGLDRRGTVTPPALSAEQQRMFGVADLGRVGQGQCGGNSPLWREAERRGERPCPSKPAR